MKAVASILSLFAALAHASHTVRRLTQADFAQGPVVIDQSNTRVHIEEDISFGQGWDLSQFFIEDTVKQTPLGFFAAIIVEADDVVIDLEGHTMAMDPEYLKVQRFFAHIELGSKPFVAGQGPADFGAFQPVSHVEIRNGVLGASSHHGIHGNECHDVEIHHLTIDNFEVAAIQLNGGTKVSIYDVNVGPSAGAAGSTASVPFAGSFSQAVFLLPHLKDAVDENPNFEIEFAGVTKTIAQVRNALIDSVADAMDSTKPTPAIFVNPTGKPDASALYGIVLHKRGAAVGGLATGTDTLDDDKTVVVRDVDIHGLELSAVQWGAVSGVSGPRGDMINFQWVLDSEGKLNAEGGNPLFQAQLALGKYNNLNADFNGFSGPFLTLSIPDDVLTWAADATRPPATQESWWSPICDGDLMHHALKGVIGVRSEFVNNLRLDEVTIKDFSTTLAAHPAWCTPFDLISSGWSAAEHVEIRADDILIQNVGEEGFRYSNVASFDVDGFQICDTECDVADWNDTCLSDNQNFALHGFVGCS